ncbi:hypothetical protein Tco_0178465 [Tanacetum coccineum]
MITYIKHVGNYKHADLKSKKFEHIQALYEKIKKFNEDFISTRSAQDERFIKRMNEKGAGLSKSEVIKEDTKEEVKDEDKDKEKNILSLTGRQYVLEQNHSLMNPKKERSSEMFVTRSNGRKDNFSVLTTLLSILSREDLNAVFQLVMDKYHDEMPEGFERVLWGDLKRKKYPLKKEILVQMLNVRLESEEESTMAFDIDKIYQEGTCA